MQFKKGSFEVGGVIYPVAIKYDSMFGDAFWNRCLVLIISISFFCVFLVEFSGLLALVHIGRI